MHRLIENAKLEQRSLLETEAMKLLKEYELPVPAFKLIKNEDEVEEIGELIDYPPVMKIVSTDIVHKSEAGGAEVGIDNERSAKETYQKIVSNARAYNDKARIYGIITYRICPVSTEVIIGMLKDPHFGPAIMFGRGGIFVEILKMSHFVSFT